MKVNEKARAFRALHEDGLLILPNAWDAASAALIERAGAKAIATTSAGVAWSLGRRDGHGLSRDEVVQAVGRIAASVEVPVTADVEGGYDDLAATVGEVIGAGAVGVNIEDAKDDGTLFDITEQADRLRTARAAAVEAGLPELVINARTDVYSLEIGPPEGRLDDVLARAAAYAEAGADCLYVIGLTDLDAIRRISEECRLPLNVLAFPGSPTSAEFEAAGARRLSVGPLVAQAAYAVAQRAAAELLVKGTCTELEGGVGYGTLNSLF
ncbi:isocitrate lyase/phosphoenolpyruvate mutase family protein [Lentzea sp. NEAU-D13]|uniref:Isocitrate lyase/phosphoenolpyruvate mutase family protein n=1 Tax=Lentzea alba TaxID=2714351 RepID=A0A7C9RVM1_9PSEU|nr:isocitrate lyase/phosphoenolpyruvate mutase family protein [Lentzea alba]NGY63226.1 isocitrate lyase/phosphoenolpyruvate mutase family protein [Lentzea alba]